MNKLHAFFFFLKAFILFDSIACFRISIDFFPVSNKDNTSTVAAPLPTGASANIKFQMIRQRQRRSNEVSI